jgi:AAA+ ATPase superfamily predicted ATPase
VLALDEFPALVYAARALPSLLQKRVDRPARGRLHVVLTGSSQRMMQGLVLDRAAPLYGRAQEILEIGPLRAGWIQRALPLNDPARAVEAYAVWGGIPRYWELAAEHRRLDEAVRELVLSPLGVLHDEPGSLLLDDLRDTAQAASLMSLIGQGCHRLSEIAARLQKPATSLSRPLQRLIELGLVRRDTPFGVHARDSKRTLYRIADPFLRFWFRYVEPNRSLLEARRVGTVAAEVDRSFAHHVASVWEELARESVPWLRCDGRSWKPAHRWWGPGTDRRPLEIDIVAESEDGRALLFGEAKWSDTPPHSELVRALRHKAERFPAVAGRRVVLGVWLKRSPTRLAGVKVFTPRAVLRVLR